MNRMRLCVFLLAVFLLAVPASATLVGWWKFDDGSGTTALDSGSLKQNGTFVNSPTWSAAGVQGGCLQFNGTNNRVNVTGSWLLPAYTISVWFKQDAVVTVQKDILSIEQQSVAVGADGIMMEIGTDARLRFLHRAPFSGTGGAANESLYTPAVSAGVWHHWAVTKTATDMTSYVDGVQAGTQANPNVFTTAADTITIGDIDSRALRPWNGSIDDLRIYDTVLSLTEILQAKNGVTSSAASNPNPADKTTDVPRDTVLTWKSGPTAATHDIYLGTSLTDVNAASRTASALLVSKGQDANVFDPPGVLKLGQTYYWRVDEVNAAPSNTIFPGPVWSFTVEPVFYTVTGITATASSSNATSIPANTINGSGLDANDLHNSDAATMWVTAKGTVLPAWIQYDLGRLRKLETMLVWNYNGLFEDSIGIGAKDVTVQYSTNGTDWTPLSGVPQFTQAPGADGYAADTIVDFGGVAARYVKLTITSHWSTNSKTTQTGLSEVRFLEMIDYARTPSPADKATGVSPSVTFSWRSGREAASANIYVGTDPNALTLSGTTATNSFAPADLSVGTTYSWRVDEVNNAATPSTWAGDVWSFTTPASIAVDDMESYNDTTNKLYEVWIDGYNTGTNGAVVGYNDSGTTGTFGDTVTFHGGKQSMPYAYGTGGVTLSEATRTFATSQDWSLHGVKTLVLYFYGSPTNTASQMYVKINNTKVNYTGDAGNISRRRWNQWNVDLTSVAGGVKAVKSLTIGLTGSGKGSLFFDDILLYKDAPAVATPVDPGTTGLVGYYAFNSNVNDSSSAGNNGTVVGTPTYVAGLSATNMAIKLNGTTDCVDLGKKAAFNPTGSFSVSLWANIGAWGTAWGHVMVSNRGETDVGGWQIRRGNSTGLCWTTRGIGGTDDLTGATPAQNEWVHVTCVFDQAAATKTLYINGLVSITGTTNANATITATTVDTYIGARATADNTSRDTFFTGMLDEVRIFNRALTAGEADFLSKP